MANIRPLTDELQKAAIEQVFEVPARIPTDLQALKVWIQQQPHLKARTDDQFLMAFLRGCKYSLEKAKSKIDKFYMLKSKFPSTFGAVDVDAKKFRQIIRLGAILVLPQPLPNNGPRLFIMRLGAYSPSEFTFEEVCHVMFAMEDITLIEDDVALINGIGYILDMTKCTAAHLFQMTPPQLKRMVVFSEEAMPLRPKSYHFVNTITGFETVFNIFKPMMTIKQQQRLNLHGNKMESLHQHIPKEYLPKEYGGSNGSIDDIIDYWENKFDQYRHYFKEEAQFGTDESLRPGKPIDFNGVFGSDGSFRKLEVD